MEAIRVGHEDIDRCGAPVAILAAVILREGAAANAIHRLMVSTCGLEFRPVNDGGIIAGSTPVFQGNRGGASARGP